MIPIFADTGVSADRVRFANERRERELRLYQLIKFHCSDDSVTVPLKDLSFENVIIAMTTDDIANVLEHFSSDELAMFIHAVGIYVWSDKRQSK